MHLTSSFVMILVLTQKLQNSILSTFIVTDERWRVGIFSKAVEGMEYYNIFTATISLSVISFANNEKKTRVFTDFRVFRETDKR